MEMEKLLWGPLMGEAERRRKEAGGNVPGVGFSSTDSFSSSSSFSFPSSDPSPFSSSLSAPSRAVCTSWERVRVLITEEHIYRGTVV